MVIDVINSWTNRTSYFLQLIAVGDGLEIFVFFAINNKSDLHFVDVGFIWVLYKG